LESNEYSAFARVNQASLKKSKRRKAVICSVLLVAMAAAVIVIIVVFSKASNDDSGGRGPRPGPIPPSGTPLDFKEYNPFFLNSTTFSEQDWYFEGYLVNLNTKSDTSDGTRTTQEFLKENNQSYFKL